MYIYTHTHRAALLHVGAVSNASQARSSSHSADCVAGWTGVYSGGGQKKAKHEGHTYSWRHSPPTAGSSLQCLCCACDVEHMPVLVEPLAVTNIIKHKNTII